MSLFNARAAATLKRPRPAGAAAAARNGKPFLGLIDSNLVNDPVDYEFDGAVARSHAFAAWTWMVRDVAPDLIDLEVGGDDPAAVQALDAVLPELLTRARTALAEAGGSREAERRLMVQLGGEEVFARLPMVLQALRSRALLDKAQSFGRALNGLTDDAALVAALQSMPLQDHATTALLMQAAVGQVTNPTRLVAAVLRIAGAPTESAIEHAGLAPVIDAVLAHAQSQIPVLAQMGPFADVDLICQAIDRFHRLVRSVNGFVEFARNGRRAMILAALTKSVSERVEPRVRDVGPDVNKALRRAREGADRFDPDLLLSALNGVYILASVRDARDSLALNAVFDQTWAQVGEALENHIPRNLDVLRQHPDDAATQQRLDAAIKMAEVRFNADYADVLRRARDAAERRT
ncbi:hypothetical protein [Devosia sp.]|uniref:hypothetical protein n=1 Tax=Devosia sp. TaxID=1871048 RepID=UPI002F1DF85A